MVRIPYIKIPSVRVGSIVPTSNIGTGGATPAPPTPITYLTQWKIVGNSEVHGNEIWSCGEYNPVDGKYHILVQPQGGSITDIALTEPLRKVNDVADTIEYPSSTEGKAVVTRNLASINLGAATYIRRATKETGKYRWQIASNAKKSTLNILCIPYLTVSANDTYKCIDGISADNSMWLLIYDSAYPNSTDAEIKKANEGIEVIYELATPTTELVDAPQIEEADSYSCEISQGAKAVSWSEFLYTLDYLLTDSENNILVDSENYQLTVQS